MLRAAAPLFLAAVLLAGCGGSATTVEAPPAPKQPFAGAQVSPPRAAPAISLRDAAGAPVTLATQRGRYVFVTFLYTRCPDVCPLIAQNLNTALRLLGRDADKVRVLAVSVDPKGDTPATVRAYARRLHLLPQFRYLIGSRAQLRRTWAAWHVLSIRRSPDLVDHVAYTALVDPSGTERVLYGSQIHAHEVVHDLRILMRRSKAA
jgi:protein SCO1/2